MRKLSTKIIIAVFAFYFGVMACVVWLAFYRETVDKHSMKSCSLAVSQRRITRSEAVELAECFVIRNGYTAYAPADDKSTIFKEWITDASSIEETLEMRHDMLRSKAYGVRKEGERGWSVIFQYNFRNPRISRSDSSYLGHLKNVGRVVTMGSYGEGLNIEHEDYELREFQNPDETSNK